LTEKRPIFHSEDDFKHDLVWKIHEQDEICNVRLERWPPSIKESMYVDIWVELEGTTCALELKYKTKKLTFEHRGEIYKLKDQAAQDIGRCDILHDIERLETIVRSGSCTTAFAISLTNDPLYWEQPKRDDVTLEAYRVHEGKTLNGTLNWAPRTAKSTIAGREGIIIRHGYGGHWNMNSPCGGGSSGEFRYLLLRVPPE